MMIAVNRGTLLALHLGRMHDAGRLTPEHISIGKLDNTREALTVTASRAGCSAATASPSTSRSCATWVNLESPLTYEGTAEVHTLILGHALTSIRAFA